MIATTFTPAPRTVLRSYRASHRRAYLVRWVLSSALVVEGLWTLSPIVSAAGVVFFALAEFSVRRQLRPYLRGPRSVTVTMTDDEYRTQGPDRATTRTWTTFQGVRRVG